MVEDETRDLKSEKRGVGLNFFFLPSWLCWVFPLAFADTTFCPALPGSVLPGGCSSGLSCPVTSGWVCQWEVPAGLKGRKRVRFGCLFPLAPFPRVTKTWLYPLTKGHSSHLVTLSYKHSSYLWAPVTAPSAYYFRGRGGNSPPTAIPVVPQHALVVSLTLPRPV